MKYLSTFEAAEKWGISHRRVNVLCNEGRITLSLIHISEPTRP